MSIFLSVTSLPVLSIADCARASSLHEGRSLAVALTMSDSNKPEYSLNTDNKLEEKQKLRAHIRGQLLRIREQLVPGKSRS
jgi:hypothetical protein